jgi:hypothetical protein
MCLPIELENASTPLAMFLRPFVRASTGFENQDRGFHGAHGPGNPSGSECAPRLSNMDDVK